MSAPRLARRPAPLAVALVAGLLAGALLAVPPGARAGEEEVRKGNDLARKLREATKGTRGAEPGARAPGPEAPVHPHHRPAPARRTGWWELASADSKGKPMNAQQLCVGPRSEQRSSAFDGIADPDSCAKAEFRKAGAGWSFESTCDYGGGIVATSHGTITGDFEKQYTVKLTTTTQRSGAVQGTVTARYLGPCPKDRKEGDEVTAGIVTNVLER